MSKSEIDGCIFICTMRIRGAKRCFPNSDCIAILELQIRDYLHLTYKNYAV